MVAIVRTFLYTIFFVSSTAYADSLMIKLISSPALLGGYDRESDKLQSYKGINEYHAEGDFVFLNGIAFGVGVSRFDIKYRQKETTARDESKFKSRYQFPYIRFAKYFQPKNKKIFFDVGGRYGIGDLEFENESTKKTVSKSLSMLGVDANLNYLVLKNISLIGGLGIWKRSGTKLSIDEYNFSEEEMDIKTIHFNFGVGVVID